MTPRKYNARKRAAVVRDYVVRKLSIRDVARRQKIGSIETVRTILREAGVPLRAPFTNDHSDPAVVAKCEEVARETFKGNSDGQG